LGIIGGNYSTATDINNAGKVVGSDYINYGQPHAILWDKGNKIALGTLGGKKSYAYGINNVGKVVGQSETNSGDTHAVLWNKGKKIDLGNSWR
jgi:probable HAF family extracellular repeat protein